MSNTAWETKTFRQYDLHHKCYQAVREQFGFSVQVAVRAIAKVADAYKLDRKDKRTFKSTGSIGYDDRILSWRLHDQTMSIWTVSGRLRIPFVCGEQQLELLQTRQGKSDMGLHKGMFFLSATCEVDEPKPIDVEGALGVDLGITNIAVDSDGQVHSASHTNNVRNRHRRLQAKMQAKGTRRPNANSSACLKKNIVLPKTRTTASVKSWLPKRKTQIERLPWKTCMVFGRGLRFVALGGQLCIVGRSSSGGLS